MIMIPITTKNAEEREECRCACLPEIGSTALPKELQSRVSTFGNTQPFESVHVLVWFPLSLGQIAGVQSPHA